MHYLITRLLIRLSGHLVCVCRFVPKVLIKAKKKFFLCNHVICNRSITMYLAREFEKKFDGKRDVCLNTLNTLNHINKYIFVIIYMNLPREGSVVLAT